MDPLSISSAIAGLVTICSQTISTCQAIIGSFQDAPRILAAIQAECSTTRESLSNIFILINKSDATALSHVSSSDTLSRSFDIALTGCTVTFSVLDNELQKILKHSENKGELDFHSRARYVWNEGALKDAMGELRGQRDALNLLVTVVQSHSISEILCLLKAKDTVFQDVKRRTDSLYRPRGNVGQVPDDRWDSDTLSIFSEYTEQKFFDFDSDIMKSPAYARVYSSVRNAQKSRRPLKSRLEPIANLLDEDLIDLHDHPPLVANYSVELENEMSPSGIESTLSAQPSTTSPDFTKNTMDNQIIDRTNSPSQTRTPDSTTSNTASTEDPEASRATAVPSGGEPTPRSPEKENSVVAATPAGGGNFSVDSGEIEIDKTDVDDIEIDESNPDGMKSDNADADETSSAMDYAASVSEQLGRMSRSERNSNAAPDGFRAVERSSPSPPGSSEITQQTAALYALEPIDLTEAPRPGPKNLRVTNPQSKILEDGAKIFIRAAASGDSASVREQLLGGTPISELDLQLALLSAALNGCVAVVEMLLLRGAKVDYKYTKEVMVCQGRHTNLSPLHLAAAANQASTIELLLKCGADVSSKDSLSWTPLHFASARGCASALQILLKHDAVIEAQACFAIETKAPPSLEWFSSGLSTNQGAAAIRLNRCTPLYMAAAFGALETVKLLVDFGANKNVKAEYGMTLLHAASLADCTNYIKEFKEETRSRYSADVIADFVRSVPLINSQKRISNSSDRAALLNYLVEIGCNPAVPDDYGFTPLHCACLHSSDIASVLIRHTNDISAKSKLGWTPLHLAALWTEVRLATILIQAGAKLELTFMTPLREGNKKLRTWSPEKQFTESLTPLGLAVAKANSVMVVHLLKNGASPQMPEYSSRSGVLDIAVDTADTAMLVLLSKQGVGFGKRGLAASNKAIEHEFSTESYLPKSLRVDIDTLDQHQRTPLLRLVQDASIKGDRTAVVQRLLDLGANPRGRYRNRTSVLHFSGRMWQDDIKVLFKAGAPLEAKDEHGFTPLLQLVRHGHRPRNVWLLIELGANIYAKANSGKSAWKLVSERYKDGIGSRALSAISSLSVSELTDDNHKSEIKKILNNAKKIKPPPPGWTE